MCNHFPICFHAPGDRDNLKRRKAGQDSREKWGRGFKSKEKEQTPKPRENKKIRHSTFKRSLLSHLKFMWHRKTFLFKCGSQSIKHQSIKQHAITVSLLVDKAPRT